jgi:glycerol-3-phosphate cytidylyltransferase
MPINRDIINQLKSKYKYKKIGFTCSCFDILHCGHCIMLEDCKNQCEVLIIGLQTDPTIDRKNKNKPIQSYEERKIMINSIKYVDEVLEYSTEAELMEILELLNPDVRIIGTDWQGKEFTGHLLPIPIHWHQRNHNWSTSNLRNRIYNVEFEKQNIIDENKQG